MEVLGLLRCGGSLLSVVLEKKRGDFVVKWVGMEAIKRSEEQRNEEVSGEGESSRDDHFGEALKSLLSRKRCAHTVAAVPAKLGLVREVVLGLTKEDHIRATVPFEAARLLAEGKPEDFIVDFHKMEEFEGKSRVLIVAMEKELVRLWIEAMQACGVNPRKVDVDVACAYNAAKGAGYNPSSEGNEALFCFAGDMVYIFLHSEGTLKKVRALYAAEGEGRLRRLVRELKRTMASAGVETKVERVVVCGDCGGNGEGLAAEFGAEFAEVELKKMAKGLDEEGMRLFMRGGYVAAGAAMKLLGLDTFEIDLRRGELAYMRPFEKLKSGLACAVTLLFFICLILAYAFRFRYARDVAALAKLKEVAREYFYGALGADEKPLVPGIRRHAVNVEEYAKAFEYVLKRRKKGMRVEEGRFSALDLLIDFASARGKASRKLKSLVLLDSISISPRQARIKIICDKEDIGPKIAENLMVPGRSGFVLDGEPKSGSERVKTKRDGQTVSQMRFWFEYILKPRKGSRSGGK